LAFFRLTSGHVKALVFFLILYRFRFIPQLLAGIGVIATVLSTAGLGCPASALSTIALRRKLLDDYLMHSGDYLR
jgi:hypothetical protein